MECKAMRSMWQTRKHRERNETIAYRYFFGMSEIKWKDEGDFWSDNYRAIYSGDKNSNTGVGIILTKEWEQRVKNYLLYNDRIMLIKLKTDENDLVIIQTYMPTSGYKDEEIEKVYEQPEEVVENVKKNDKLIMLGDWNAVVVRDKKGAQSENMD